MEYILIGKMIKPFGLKGEMATEVYTDFIKERFKKGSAVYLKTKSGMLKMIVLKYRMHKGRLLLTFEGYEDINLIEMYRMVEIYKSTDDIEPLKEGEYYFRDLMNLKVYVDDNCVGTVVDVEEGTTSNFIRVKKNDNTEALVPFIPVFIKSVSLNEGKIVLNYIEGLLWR